MKNTIDPRILLSALWAFVLFNMIFRDLHEFLNEQYLEELMTLHISEERMLLYGMILEIPIAMVLLALMLPAHLNKWANTLVALLTIFAQWSMLPGADMDDFFFTAISSLAFFAIIRKAWTLPSAVVLKEIPN
ncbi:MAG: DUF6326 family protein [Bacteroidota bacterium]